MLHIDAEPAQFLCSKVTERYSYLALLSALGFERQKVSDKGNISKQAQFFSQDITVLPWAEGLGNLGFEILGSLRSSMQPPSSHP